MVGFQNRIAMMSRIPQPLCNALEQYNHKTENEHIRGINLYGECQVCNKLQHL